MSKLTAWLRATRAFSFTATIIPVSLAAVVAYRSGFRVDWFIFLLTLLGGLFINAASDLTNEYYDFINGIDKPGVTGSSGVLIEGSLKPDQVRSGYILFYALAVILGTYFIYLRGPLMAVIIIAGLIAGYTYTSGKHGYKYYALGELMCFLFYGPIMALGGYVALTGRYDNYVMIASVPVGFLVAAILDGNNVRDRKDDKKAGILTLAILLGERGIRIFYSALILLPYAYVAALVAINSLPAWTLLVFLTILMPAGLIRTIYLGSRDDIHSIDMNTAKLHLAFGLIYILTMIPWK